MVNTHFFTKTSQFASQATFEQVRSKIFEVNLKTRIETLMHNDETGYLNDSCPSIFERVVADLLTQSREFLFKSKSTVDQDWKPVSLRLNKQSDGQLPKFTDMEENVLYRPLNTKFPVVDYFSRRMICCTEFK
jgi:hypothetical protein